MHRVVQICYPGPWDLVSSCHCESFVDGLSVGMNGSSSSPAWEVHAVSYTAEGIEPFMNPFLSCPFVRCKGGAVIVAAQALSGGCCVRVWSWCQYLLVCSGVPP